MNVVFPIMIPDFKLGTSIPRIIHQCVFQGWESISPEIRADIAALRARNPDWDYRFYDAAAAEAFIAAVYGDAILALYLAIDPQYYAARADLFRYLVCYHTGGVYLDCKSTALLPLDQVIRQDDVFLLAQWPEHRAKAPEQSNFKEFRHIQGGAYLQWFIVSAPGHPFLRSVLERVLQSIQTYRVFQMGVGRDGVFRLTGPIAYTLAIDPIRALHPHRYVKSDLDLHFVYSIFNDHKSHRFVFRTHYSQLTIPVIRQRPVTSSLATIWFGNFKPRINQIQRRVTNIFRNFR
jgi:mannosyltransferase OCH1-like enzyme